METRTYKQLRLSVLCLIICSLLLFNSHAHAVDQQWLSLQADHPLSNEDQLSLNFHRRDSGDLYSNRLLNVYRLHYSIPFADWNLILGAAYFDSASGSNERRLHQYAERSLDFVDSNYVSTSIRLGLEERDFNSDGFLYLRFRARALFNLLPTRSFGPSFYHESFFIPNGQDRFSSTLSENRTGLGLRYSHPSAHFLLYHTYTFLRLPGQLRYEQWWQLLINFPF